MHRITIQKAAGLLSFAVVLALTGCAAPPRSQAFVCSSDGTGEFKLRDGSRFVGEYHCHRGEARIAGKGTLHEPGGKVIKATRWWGDFDDRAPSGSGEVEVRFPSGATQRYQTGNPGWRFGRWFYDVPTEGSGPVTGPTLLTYIVFPDGDDLWEIKVSDKRVIWHTGPMRIQQRRINCGGVPAGYVMTSGTCQGGNPDGLVTLYTAGGLERLNVRYANGQPSGLMRYQKIVIKSAREENNKFFFPNIVSGTDLRKDGGYTRDIVELEEFHVATGTPKIVQTGTQTKLEFARLDRYSRHVNDGNESFSGGYTTNLLPNGTGRCDKNHYDATPNKDQISRQKRSDLSYAPESCSYNGSVYLVRSDKAANDRYHASVAASEQRDRELEARRAESERELQAAVRRAAAINRSGNDSIAAHIAQRGAEDAARLNRIDRQTLAAVNESNRAAQAARERAAGTASRQIPSGATQPRDTETRASGAGTSRSSEPDGRIVLSQRTDPPSRTAAPGNVTKPRQPFAEPDPYKGNGWGHHGAGAASSRAAACTEAQRQGDAEKARLSSVWRYDAVSPCVCGVNIGASASVLDNMAQTGAADNWSCSVYEKRTRIRDTGNTSR